jgi:hypothetical protein
MRRVVIGLVLVSAAAAAAQSKKSKWVTHAPEDHRYKVKFPKKPTSDSPKNLATAAGVVRLDTDHVDADGMELAVTVATYPDGFKDVAAKTILDGVRDGLKGSDGVLFADEEVTLETGGAAVGGREFKVGAGRNLIRCRAYLVGNKLYQVMATGPKDLADGPAAEPFFKSFALTAEK